MPARTAKLDDAADFHLYASAYEGRDWMWYRHLVADCVKHCVPGGFLDLGCGTGLLTECASRFGLDMIGVDGSELAVATALKRNQRVLRHDLRNPLEFGDLSFDAIISIN